MRGWHSLGLGLLLFFAIGCKSKKNEAVVYTSVDRVFSHPVFKMCESSAELSVRSLFDTEETKSTGVVNRLIAEAKNPQADVFWSGDPVRPFLLMQRGLVEPYRSAKADGMPEVFGDKEGRWTGLAARARVLLVNSQRVSKDEMPTSLRDLLKPQWRGKTAIANPLFGTTTMHMAALLSIWGEEKTKAFFQELKENDVVVASSNGEVKRLVVSGEVAFGLTDTDDAYEALASGSPVQIVYPDQEGIGTLVMPTTVVLLKNGPNPAKGKALIDCLLSAKTEEYLATHGAHMPLRKGVAAAPLAVPISEIRAMQVDYEEVAKKMEEMQPWLREWAEL